MNPAETAVILRQFNEWRRGDEDIPQFDPREIGEAIDAAVEMIERLEAAEKAVNEACQRGYETGQEEIEKDLEIERMRLAACGVAALGYFEGCAKEYQSASLAEVIALRKRFEAAEKERDELRAKIAEMERQEPVAEWVDGAFDQYPHLRWREPYKAIAGAKLYTKFYALPGAKGEGK